MSIRDDLEAVCPPMDVSSPPDFLKGDALALWHLVGKVMVDDGVFISVDEALFSVWCTSAARILNARRQGLAAIESAELKRWNDMLLIPHQLMERAVAKLLQEAAS